MGWVWLIFISALSLCLLFSGCLHLYPSFDRSVSVHLSLSVLSTEQQRFINGPAWFLAIPASSDLSLLEFIKKTLTLHCNLTGSLHHSYFFYVCFSLCNLSFTLAKRKQQHKIPPAILLSQILKKDFFTSSPHHLEFALLAICISSSSPSLTSLLSLTVYRAERGLGATVV